MIKLADLQYRIFAASAHGGSWPISAAPVVCLRVRCRAQSSRALGWAGAAVDDPQRHFATINCRIAKGLFNHLVGDGENRRGHLDADRSRSLQVDDELEFG
jgi:hypothetical protein